MKKGGEGESADVVRDGKITPPLPSLPPSIPPSISLCLPPQGEMASLETSKPYKQISRNPAALTTDKHVRIHLKIPRKSSTWRLINILYNKHVEHI